MASNPQDIFARFRTGGAPAPAQPQSPSAPQAQDQDIFARFRTENTKLPVHFREDNTLGEEFVAGLGSGIDGVQGSLYGVAGLAGRELGIDWMEKAGNENAARNFEEAARNGRQSEGFTEIENAGGFFRWAAASLGEAVPSLALAMTGGGIGAAAGRKAVELGVKKSLARSVERRLGAMGFDREAAILSARDYMTSSTGQTALARAITGQRTGTIISEAAARASRIGQVSGTVAAASLPQIGAIDQELQRAGVSDPGLTALLGGVVGGALEAVPALRLMDKMFPGVDRQVSKAFVKDFAVATGTQAALEGTTEAAQEMIQLAALAYHDPTFDMFSPDAKNRVINAFAAGALVGAVTGGGAEAIGEVGTVTRAGGRVAKKAAPVIGAWSMTAKDAALGAGVAIVNKFSNDSQTSEQEFRPADNTLFEEVKGRVYAAVQPHIESAVNSLQAQVDKVTSSLNENLEGGVNAESAKISDIAKAAHETFIKKHATRIEQTKTFLNEQTTRISEAAAAIKDPAKRGLYIEGEVAALRVRLSGYIEQIRKEAVERDKRVEAEVDNMDITDDMVQEILGENSQEARDKNQANVDELMQPGGDRDAQTGHVEAAPIMRFGHMQSTPEPDVDGNDTVAPYKTKAAAIAGQGSLGRRFRSDTKLKKDGTDRKLEDTFRIKKVEGGYEIEVIDREVMESLKFFNDLNRSRDSHKRRKDTPESRKRKVELLNFDGKKFGFPANTKSLKLDLVTLAWAGKNLDKTNPGNVSMEQGFLAMVGEMLQRGMITNMQATRMHAKFQKHFGEAGKVTVEEFGSQAKFPAGSKKPDGVAKANMMSFISKMKAKGIKIPFNMINTFRNDDGTYSWGIDDVSAFRALGAKDRAAYTAIAEGIKNENRQEQLATASQDAREFSGNATLGQTGAGRRTTGTSGDLGDTRGRTAGSPDVDVVGRVERNSLPIRKTDPELGPSQLEFNENAEDVGDPVEGALLKERRSSLQGNDQKTDPKKHPREFDDQSDPSVRNRGRRANENSKKLADRDRRILKRYGQPGKFKMLVDANIPLGVQSALNSIGHFVTKTLGLSNQVTMVDNHGLKLLIDSGKVSDPIFLQTLNDPSVHARNIRVGDQSFVYLSPKVLQDEAATVLAFSHEMGHHLYRVAWDKLTPEAQQRLKDAYVKDVGVAQAFPGTEVVQSPTSAGKKAEIARLQKKLVTLKAKWKKEDAGVSLQDEITNTEMLIRDFESGQFSNSQDPASQQTADRLKQDLKDLEQQRDERDLAEFKIQDAIANKTPPSARLRSTAPDALNEAGFNEWMADQLAAWIARPIRQGGDPGRFFFQKIAQQVRKLYDFVANNKRFQLNETFKEFADAVAMRTRDGSTHAENPLSTEGMPYNQALMKQWFRNEGVTMYQFFGETLESDNMDFAPVTAEGKKALATVTKKYPAMVKRAALIRNWMVAAYKMAIAPSTSAVRDIAARIPVAKELVLMFNRGAQGAAKVGGQNYHQGVELMRGQFMDKFKAIGLRIEAEIKAKRPGIKNKDLQVLVNAEMRRMALSLRKKEGKQNQAFTPNEKLIRNLFDNMHTYATKAGLPVHKIENYFPRQFDRELLVNNKQEILDHLTNTRGLALTKARHMYNSLIDPHANDGRATQDATETPGFTAMNSREATDKFFDKYLDDNTQGIVGNYVNQVVKRAEFNRRLGEAMPATDLTAKEAIAKGIWDPKAKMHAILAQAKKEKATDEELVILEKYIDANLGQLGRDSIMGQPGMRRFMAGVMAYQNMRVLMFTVFASLPDGVGPAIRSGSMKDTWTTLKNNIGNIAKSDSDLADMAHALGIIQDTASEHIMTEYVDNHYMPAGLRKMNDNFFKYTGLNWYTDFTRKYALAVGIDYIENSYRAFVEGDTPQKQARGKDMLAELGMTPGDAKKWIDAGKPTYDSESHAMDGTERKAAEALIQFVDESIMRPNASQRPIMASHPGAMLVYHLKGYMYAVHDIVLKRIKFNIDESDSPAQYAAAIAPALAMMLLTAVGLELRELIQYAGSNRKPPTDRMDGWDYTWELAQRSGLTGFGQIAFDFQGAEDRGMSHVAGIGGPALSQAADIISKPSTQTIPKAIPIIGQIPAAREMVRNIIR